MHLLTSNRRPAARLAVVSMLLALLPGSIATAHDWPQFLGPDHDGISKETGWSDIGREEPAWKRSVGIGYSSPSIAAGRLYTIGHDKDAEKDTVLCLDALTGAVKWQYSFPSKILANFHDGGALTTPTVRGDDLFVAHRFGRLFRLRAKDGKVLWERDLAKELEIEPPFHGFVGSPYLLDEETMALNFGRHLLTLKTADGSIIWKSPKYKESYSAIPVPWTIDGKRGLAVYTGAGLSVFDAATGAELRSFPWTGGAGGVNCAVPIIIGNRALISSAYNLGAAFIEARPDGEWEVLWSSRRLRNKLNGCVLIGEHLYGFDESMLKCFGLDGEEKWRHRGFGLGSLSASDGRLLIITSAGELVIADASPKGYHERSRTKVLEGGQYWTPPVLVDGRIYCRSSLGDMVCLDHTGGAGSVTAQADLAGATPAAELPKAIDLFRRHLEAIGGETAVRRHTSMTMTGTLESPSAGGVGLPARFESRFPNQTLLTFEFPGMGTVKECFDGTRAWKSHPWEFTGLVEDDELREWKEVADFYGDLDYERTYASLQTRGIVTFDDRPCYLVEAVSPAGARRNVYFDVATGLKAGRQSPAERLVALDDYKEFDGRRVPTRIRTLEPETGDERKFTIHAVTFDTVESSAFEPVEAIRWMLLNPEEVAARNAAAEKEHAEILGIYCGAFMDEPEFEATIGITRGRVSFNSAGFPPQVMEGPNQQGEWVFEGMTFITMKFERNGDGRVEALAIRESDKNYRLERQSRPER